MVDRLVMVPYRPKRVAGSAATGDEALAGALVLYNGPAWTPRWYVPRWTSERLVLSKLPPRSSLVVGLDAATKAVYNELMQREETSYGDDELDDVPGGPEWDERRREFKLKVDHFMPIVRNIIGDRKFSRWGGSVVTSIVGTFLTQNVTDNSSSNAFMTMAAKFPPKNCSNVKQNLEVPLPLTDGHDEQRHCHLQSEPPSCSGGSESGVTEHGDSSQQSPKQGKCGDKDLDALLSALRSGDISNWDEKHIKDVLSVRFGESTAGTICGTKEKPIPFVVDTSHWDSLRQEACNYRGYEKVDSPDMIDWEALMNAPFADVLDCIRDRGQHSLMAFRILAFLIRIKRDHGSIDLEWLRFIPRAKAKRYLVSINGLGAKSVDCIRLLSLRHRAFPASYFF